MFRIIFVTQYVNIITGNNSTDFAFTYLNVSTETDFPEA